MIRVTSPAPAPEVASFVQGIFILEYQGKAPFRLPLFANGRPALVFHSIKDRHTNRQLTFFGQTVCPDELLFDREFILIAYFLWPWCLASLFRLAAGELTDKPIDYTFLSKDRDLGDKLLNAASIPQMLVLLNEHILRLASCGSPEDPRVKYAATRIASMPQKDILTKVRQDLCITERSFQRLFERNIGVSPNQFRRIVKFDSAFRQLNEGKFINLSDVAFDNGYADQSHFNRAFREFTDQTATHYLDNLPAG